MHRTKRWMGIPCFLLCGNTQAFSLQETWLSAGFEWGNLIEVADGTRYLGAPGFNLKTYGFENRKDIGFYLHWAYSFPTIAQVQPGAKNRNFLEP